MSEVTEALTEVTAAERRELRDLRAEVDRLQRIADYSGRPLKPPRWTTPKRTAGEKRAIVCTILSDLHLDEVVNPAEIDGINAYDRTIAEQRLKRYFGNVGKLANEYLQGMAYDGCVLMLGGDLISGDIHEELAETNEGTALETVLFWTERLAAGISLLADTFGRVHVPVVVGNHGRRTRKPRAKRRARDNFDWLIGQMLARHFHEDSRVTFEIPDGTDVLVEVYDTRFLLTHGDQVGGGGGIGGIWPGVMRMRAKKQDRYSAQGGFNTVVMGHFHQLIMAPDAGIIVNGSTKGLDEYAASINAKPERPQQALWTVAPGRGVTFSAAVHVADRASEGW